MFRTIISLIIYPLGVTTFVLSSSVYLFLALFIAPQKLYLLAKLISRAFLLSCGQWVTYDGVTPPKEGGPYLYMFNHQSMFDGFLLVGSFRHYVTGVGAQKQFSWFIWGWIVKRYGVIPIKRSKLNQAIHSLEAMEKVMNTGVSCLISPEGTRTLTGEMITFKKGAFHVAQNTKATIVPIGINGAYEAKPKNDWRFKPGRIRMTYGEFISWDTYKDMSLEELRDTVKEKISKLAY
ncbi:MAG: 1-acyl-sn-glycerol-3-phosphate acyltransferase [Candidatus Marinimicrobia bacterium]|nr:1-acyl-sn-glycerol-3-phosphate acyltransferase [Candidatus Neomarinimicrobiota bacterium]